MNNLKVLITGGAGFVGSNLASALTGIYPDASITILDDLSTGSFDKFKAPIRVYSTLIEGHTKDLDNIFKDEKFDIVYHFGEYSRITTSFADVDTVMDSNLVGTYKVIQACLKWNAKLIYSASSSKFGNNGADENLSPYAWIKAKMVEMIKNYHEWFGLEYEICYFYNVYGPGQIEVGDYATVVGIFENQYRNGKPLTVVGDGSQTRDFTHVSDIVNGVIKSSISNYNGEWHLRSGRVVSILELANMFKGARIEHIPTRRGERIGVTELGDNTKADLAWEPIHDIEEYIKNLNLN